MGDAPMTMQRQSVHPRADPPKHFSMLRTFHLADFFTLANAACGMVSIFYAMIYVSSRSVGDFLIAAGMTPAAFVFDVLDGRIARWRHQHSALASWILWRTSSRLVLRPRLWGSRLACAAAGTWPR
jgi:CDP-alcohol phosphatidyltransferase-like enzyme